MNPRSRERLDALDRRAAVAVAEIDRRLPTAPEWTAGPEPGLQRRRLRPLLVAAAAVVIVVAGLTVARLDGGNDQSTIAGETPTGDTGEFVRLAIPDPATVGLEVTAAYDGISTPSSPDQESTIQGPDDASDPWTNAVQVFTSSVDPESGRGLYGEIVDLGAADGSFVHGPTIGLQWVDGDLLHTMYSTVLDEDELVDLASDAVRNGWRGDGPLPGQRILHTAWLGETYPTLPYLSPPADIDVAAVGYRNADLAFAVGVMPGTQDRYRALQVFGDTEPVTVRGREGVIVRHQGIGDLVGIVWRENDQTVVRVETYDDPRQVIEQLGALETTDEQAFDALVRANPLDDERRLLEIPPEEFDRQGDPDDNPPDEILAEISSERNGQGVRALLYRNDGEATQFDFMTDDENGGSSGSGSSLLDLDEPFVSRSSDGTRDIFGGIVPGEIESIEVEAADARRIDDFEQVPADGSDAMLFVAWSDSASLDATTVLRFTLTNGRVIRYAA